MVARYVLSLGLVTLLCQSAVAEEKQTVLAVAKIAGITKTVDRRVYHLIAVRCYDSEVWIKAQSGAGLLDDRPVVRCGDRPVIDLDPDEAKKWGGRGLSWEEIRWVALPEKGVLEVRYGLASRLNGKEPRVAFKTDVAKLPEVKADSRHELSKAMERLLPRAGDGGKKADK